MANTKDPGNTDSRPEPTAGNVEPPDASQGEDDKPSRPVEIGGRKGPDPTRYGDWEKGGRCIDF